MTNIAAGRLRHVVSIERQVEIIDSNGDHSREWEYVTSLRAEVKDLSGRELLLAQQVQSSVSTDIVTRFNASVDATCRIKHNGVVYNVTAVIHDANSGREFMVLRCERGLNDG